MEGRAGVLEIEDEIEHLLENIPDKRKKKEYNIWKSQVNALILQINTEAKMKLYHTIK